MLLLRIILTAAFMPCLAAAQSNQDSVKLNRLDAKGRRTGMWYTQVPERMGEDAYAEFGAYINGRKGGKWYRWNKEGDLLAEENFRLGTLDGEVKYFEDGRLTTIGHYRGLNPTQALDTIIVVDPVTRNEALVSISTDRGSLRHGIWQYYDPHTGRLVREEEYQVDEIIHQKEFGMTASDSTYYNQRLQAMPHNRGIYYKPPRGKRSITR